METLQDTHCMSTAYAKGFVIGDVGSGKSSTISSITNANLRTRSETGATVFGEDTSGTLNFTYQGTSIAITFNEVNSGSSDFSQGFFLSSLLCVICFDTRDNKSLENVFSHWIPFKEKYMPDSFVVLVGCFSDCHLQRKADIEGVFERLHGTDVLYLDISNEDHTNIKLLQSVICARAIEVVTLMESLPEDINLAQQAAESLSKVMADADDVEHSTAENEIALPSTYSLAEFVNKTQTRSDIPASELEEEVNKFLDTLREEAPLGVASATNLPENEAPVATYEEIREAMKLCGFEAAFNDSTDDSTVQVLSSNKQKLRLKVDGKRTVEFTIDTKINVREQIEQQLYALRAGSDADIVKWADQATQAVQRQTKRNHVAEEVDMIRTQLSSVPVARIRTNLDGNTEHIDILSEDTPIEVLDRLETQTGMALTLNQRARILTQIAPYIKSSSS